MEHHKKSDFIANCQFGGSKNKFLDKNRTFTRIDFKRNISNGKITKTSKKPVIPEKTISLKIPVEEKQYGLQKERIVYKSVEFSTEFEKGFTKPELFNQIFDFYNQYGIDYKYQCYEKNDLGMYVMTIKTKNIKNITIESLDLNSAKNTGEYELEVSFKTPNL